MGGLEAVIAHGAGGGKSDVDDGGPALEFVMTVVVEQIGNADGRCGAGCFDDCEGRMIIDDVVGEQNFLAAAADAYSGWRNNRVYGKRLHRQRASRWLRPKRDVRLRSWLLPLAPGQWALWPEVLDPARASIPGRGDFGRRTRERARATIRMELHAAT